MAESFGRTTIWETSASVTTTAGSGVLPTFRAASGMSLAGRRETVVPLEALGQLPNLEFFASLSGGRLWKGRMPILDPDLEGLKLFADRPKYRPVKAFLKRLRLPGALRRLFREGAGAVGREMAQKEAQTEEGALK